ncbi:phage tail tube protein [Pelosinus propionicus]|uniref:Phage major tail protein, TP901-1 family n=1 Tax=Pelosinus propionicus DSM 13327 TaxID=1123291 RepID=A0A1I4N0Y3_9FIRM|nr:phage tail tube protein [Pelosinus propionicus]SFM09128.1 phage major tail protein, TP901-1 family [Pelosinus propionicus DSM 13327]
MVEFKFNLQNHAAELPTNPSTSKATVGKDYLAYINTGTVDIPDWTLIGGQRGASLGLTADEIDVSNKGSGGWSAKLAGNKSWSIDLDGLLLLNNDGIEALRRVFNQSIQANIKFRYPDNNYQIGWASVTDFSGEAPHDGEASLKATLNGVGPISNISVLVSKTAPTDETFYFEKLATATAVKLGTTSVTAENYIATEEGEITFDSDYLATLAVGEHLFYVDLSIGGQSLVAIRIKA